MDKYLVILIDSLNKKNNILDEISEICDKQDIKLEADDFSLEEYNDLMTRKGELIDEMNKQDDGFTALYARVSAMLKQSTADYREPIKKMQALVQEISEKTALIQAKEMRIQSRVDQILSSSYSKGARHVVKSDAAQRYSRIMKQTNVRTPSIFLDSKK